MILVLLLFSLRDSKRKKEKWKRNENFSQDFKVTLYHRLQHIQSHYTANTVVLHCIFLFIADVLVVQGNMMRESCIKNIWRNIQIEICGYKHKVNNCTSLCRNISYTFPSCSCSVNRIWWSNGQMCVYTDWNKRWTLLNVRWVNYNSRRAAV